MPFNTESPPTTSPVALSRRTSGLQGPAPNKGLHPDVRRHRVHGSAAPGDNRVDADAVVVPEGLPLSMDGGEGDHRGVQCVDPLMVCGPGVGGPADELDALGDHAVIGCATSRPLQPHRAHAVLDDYLGTEGLGEALDTLQDVLGDLPARKHGPAPAGTGLLVAEVDGMKAQ